MKRVLLPVGLLIALTGCGGDDGGAPPLPPITAEPTVSASPAVTAYPRTPQGAAAFARFVLEEIDRAYVEKDPELVRRYFEPGCKTCANYIRALERIQQEDITVVGGDSTILSAETPGGQSGLTVEVSVRSDYEGITLKDKNGKVVLREEPAEVQETVVLQRVDSSFKVLKIIQAS